MYQKSLIHYITKICIDILFYTGILCCLLIPFSSRWMMDYFYVANERVVRKVYNDKL
ncbi:MAG: hypothetical protein WBJ13_04820 [Sedimentibacter sp.]